MQGSRRQRVALGVLVVVLAAVVVWQLQPSGNSPAPSGAGMPHAGPAPRRGQNAGPVGPVDVTLERLEAETPEPEEGGRSPFRFGAATSAAVVPGETGPAHPTGPTTGAPGMPSAPTGPPPPPPPPPIPFKFIGIVSSASTGGKIAVLSDGKFVYHGREGDIIDGRFRVVRIGEESIQMEYFDGRGRQTIRLTGS